MRRTDKERIKRIENLDLSIPLPARKNQTSFFYYFDSPIKN
jgi:hypothetical protein